jgi:hypothetical protein
MFIRLFEDEEQDLFKDMQSLPRNAALRKMNDLIKTARLAKVIQKLGNSKQIMNLPIVLPWCDPIIQYLSALPVLVI